MSSLKDKIELTEKIYQKFFPTLKADNPYRLIQEVLLLRASDRSETEEFLKFICDDKDFIPSGEEKQRVIELKQKWLNIKSNNMVDNFEQQDNEKKYKKKFEKYFLENKGKIPNLKKKELEFVQNKLRLSQNEAQKIETPYRLYFQQLLEEMKKSNSDSQKAIECLRDSQESFNLKDEDIKKLRKIAEYNLLSSKKRYWTGGLAIVSLFLLVVILSQETFQVIASNSDSCTMDSGVRGEEKNISCGEESLFPTITEINSIAEIKNNRFREFKQGVEKLNKGEKEQAKEHFEKAKDYFTDALHESVIKKDSDPEALIYANNAQLLAKNEEYYTIAIVVSINPEEDTTWGLSKQILRGVAQAQKKINTSEKINGRELRVLIANDSNNPKKAKKIAERLVNSPDVIAVIGHTTSGNTSVAQSIYQESGLVLITATSTKDGLSKICEDSKNKSKPCMMFRIPSPNKELAKHLASYLSRHAPVGSEGKIKAIPFITKDKDGKIGYSENFHLNFKNEFEQRNGEVLKEFDLLDNSWNVEEVLDKAEKDNISVIVLIPDDDEALKRAVEVIKKNKGRFWIAGGDTLYDIHGKDELTVSDIKDQHIIITAQWHPLDKNTGCKSQTGENFCKQASELWGTPSVSWEAATTFDAANALIEALKLIPISKNNKNDQQNLRLLLQKNLVDPKLKVKWVTGYARGKEESKINFDPKTGERQIVITQKDKSIPIEPQLVRALPYCPSTKELSEPQNFSETKYSYYPVEFGNENVDCISRNK